MNCVACRSRATAFAVIDLEGVGTRHLNVCAPCGERWKSYGLAVTAVQPAADVTESGPVLGPLGEGTSATGSTAADGMTRSG